MELEDTASDETSSDESVVLVSARVKPQSSKTQEPESMDTESDPEEETVSASVAARKRKAAMHQKKKKKIIPEEGKEHHKDSSQCFQLPEDAHCDTRPQYWIGHRHHKTTFINSQSLIIYP